MHWHTWQILSGLRSLGWVGWGKPQNPPGLKVPRRGSLAADDINRYSFSWGGAIFIVEIVGFDPALPQDGLHKGPTLANKAPTSAQIPTWLQLRPNLDPTWHNLATSWTHWEKLRPKLISTWAHHGGHGRPNTESSKHTLSLGFSTSFGVDDEQCSHVVSPLGPNGFEAVAKGLQAADLDLQVHHMPSLTPVGYHEPTFSVLFTGRGRYSSRSDSNMTHCHCQGPYHLPKG